MLVKDVFYYATYNASYDDGTGEPFEMSSILNTYTSLSEKVPHEVALKHINKNKSQEELKKIAQEELQDMVGMDYEVLKVEPVYIKKRTKWFAGEYLAHEYEYSYHPGRGRRIEWSNGLIEYQIECLNKDLTVLDGAWEEYDNNGYGDRFTPSEEGLNAN